MIFVAIPILLLLAFIGNYMYTKHKNKPKLLSETEAGSLAAAELKNTESGGKNGAQNSNSGKDNNGAEDVEYLLTNLDPKSSTHLDVLLLLATTPENIKMTNQLLEREQELKDKRMEYLNPKAETENTENATSGTVGEFDLNGSWGDDDDDDDNDEAVKANKARQEEKEKLKKEVAAASGKSDDMIKNIRIESIDEGVLGQMWVERTLASIGQWPPKPTSNSTSDLSVFDDIESNPAVRRNLCMTMGRLNSQVLNAHPDLMAAGPKKLIDALYFQSSMEYRKRTIVLLEAALRIIGATRSHKLYKTCVECYTMFKIGTTSVTSPEIITLFQKQMEKTFDGPKGVPRIIISKLDIGTPDEKEIVNEDISLLELELHRVHGENFMKQKIAMAMKQGIPPQIALQTFREGWWILLRCEKLDGDAADDTSFIDKNIVFSTLSEGTKNKYKTEKDGDRLINAWPFMVSNMKQTVGKVKVRFMVPKLPGKYKFYIDVKSQEYLGCDQTFTLEKEVLDKDTVVRAEKKKVEEKSQEGDDADSDEPKKTK